MFYMLKEKNLTKMLKSNFLLDIVTSLKLTKFSNHKMKKNLVSRDVKFMEDQQWNSDEQ